MFSSLSEFAQKVNELERERRSQLRLYIMLPYIGAIMIIATTGLLLGFINNPAFSFAGSPARVPGEASSLATGLFAGLLVEAWVMGFVAGKMGEGTISAGFKHAGIIVVVSLITIYILRASFPSL